MQRAEALIFVIDSLRVQQFICFQLGKIISFNVRWKKKKKKLYSIVVVEFLRRHDISNLFDKVSHCLQS